MRTDHQSSLTRFSDLTSAQCDGPVYQSWQPPQYDNSQLASHTADQHSVVAELIFH